MRNLHTLLSFCAGLLALFLCTIDAHAGLAGHVQFVNGTVRVIGADGVTRPLKKGEAVQEGDAISTAAFSSAQIKTIDGGFIAVRPETEMKFDQFVFNGRADGTERGFFSLVKGGFRAVTGLVGRVNKQNYKITTPAATIGIRGTDHESVVVPPPLPGMPAPLVPPGAYSKVNVGETTLTTNLGTINVGPNQMGYAGGMDMKPQLQPINPNLFTVTPVPGKSIKQREEEKKSEQQQGQSADRQEPQEKQDGQGQGGQTAVKSADRQEAQEKQDGQGQGGQIAAKPADKPAEQQAAAPQTAQQEPSAAAAPGKASVTLASTAEGGVRVTTSVATGNTAVVTVPAPSVQALAPLAPVVAPLPAVKVILSNAEDAQLDATTQDVINPLTGETAKVSSDTAANVAAATPVLPPLSACIADRTLAGCTSVLPSLATCTAAPATVGCSAVLTPAITVTDRAVAFNVANSYFWNSTFTTAPNSIVTGSSNPSFSYPGWDGRPQSLSFTASGHTTGTATSNSAISFGRYSNVSFFSATDEGSFGHLMGGDRPGVWAYGIPGYLDAAYLPTTPFPAPLTGVMAGTFTYQFDGGGAIDSNGNPASISALTLSANFVSNTLTANLTANAANAIWKAQASGVPISGSVFWFSSGDPNTTSSVTRGQTGNETCTTCSWWMQGSFTGQNYAGAALAFSLQEQGGLSGHYSVDGVAALTRNYSGDNTNPVVANATGVTVPNGYVVLTAGAGMGANMQIADTVTLSNNVLTGWSQGAPKTTGGMSRTITCSVCSGQSAADFANTTIRFGTWDAGGSSTTWSTTFPNGQPMHWISGPATPVYLVPAMLGTATFAYDGGTQPTSITNSGTPVLGSVSNASLTADFNKQAVSLAFTVVADGHTWQVNATDAPLGDSNGMNGAAFRASTGVTGPGALSIKLDGNPVAGMGSTVNGQLSGANLNGALFEYQLSTMLDTQQIISVNGVAALKQTAASNASGVPTTIDPAAVQARFVAFTNTDPAKGIQANGTMNNASRVTQDASGHVTAFDIGSQVYFSSRRLAIDANVVKNDTGLDAVSGIRWGRWSGGNLVATDRISGATAPLANTHTHWITGPVSSIQVTLPVSGTVNYVFAGGTKPTDSAGNVGTLNSATLEANFTAQTVNAGVNATVNNVNYVINANGMAIRNAMFDSGSASSLTATAGNTAAQGFIGGVFTGANGNGAGMVYALQNGNTTVNGVAAFHAP